MTVTATPAPKSAIKLEIELPPERLNRAVNEAVRRLSRQTRVPGFRPGKAPRPVLERVLGPGAVLDEAVEQLVQDAYREALLEKEILPLARPNVDVVQAEEGKPVIFTATVQVRPDVALGDYRNFNFKPEIDTIDDARVDKVVDELRDQNGTLSPVENRGAHTGDYAVIAFQGTRDGEPFEGGSSDRLPLILGDERYVPGFESNLEGLRVGESKDFDLTFPEDYPDESMRSKVVHFHAELRELREKVLPDADDAFAQSMGDFAGVAAMRDEIRLRLERSAIDRARHEFADRIIDYAVANSTIDLPDVLVDQEVEVMHDEFRTSLARQGLTEEAYLKVVGKTEQDLHADLRPQAEKRVKTLLVLSKIGDSEGIDVSDREVEAEVARGRERYAGDRKLIGYLESERGRSFIRSTLRRSAVVERLVDDWLATHPDHPRLPHVEEAEAEAAESAARAAASAAGVADVAGPAESFAPAEPAEPVGSSAPAGPAESTISTSESIDESDTVTAPTATGSAG
jgi:trigger factor